MRLLTILAMTGTLFLGACATKTMEIDNAQDAEYLTAGLSDRDFEKAASKMLDDVLTNELSNPKKGGGRYLMEIGTVKNDTMQKINTEDLTDYIKKEMRRSGKVMVTNLGENQSINNSRDLADSAIINKSTVVKKAGVLAPEISLFGRISQKDFIIGSDKKIEYIFSLSLTDLETGIEMWSDKQVIRKITDKDELSW